jgi:hypothetical protein
MRCGLHDRWHLRAQLYGPNTTHYQKQLEDRLEQFWLVQHNTQAEPSLALPPELDMIIKPGGSLAPAAAAAFVLLPDTA